MTLTHRSSGTRLHIIWKNMRQRCNNSNNESYKNYGGREIKICEEWNTFSVFEEWAHKTGYSDFKTIERVNNDLGYSPSNCKWVLREEQPLNSRQVLNITAFDETKSVQQWSEDPRCKVKYSTLLYRINKGWPPEKAITSIKYPTKLGDSSC